MQNLPKPIPHETSEESVSSELVIRVLQFERVRPNGVKYWLCQQQRKIATRYSLRLDTELARNFESIKDSDQ